MKFPALPLPLKLALGMAIAVAPAASADMLIDIQGSSVQLSPNEVGKPVPARIGTTLGVGDVLSVGEGVTATVLCSDGTLWKLGSGESGALETGCLNTSVATSQGAMAGGNDAVNLAGYPYTTSPRFTLVQPQNFTMAWNPVVGASKYKVQIGELFGAVWETETSKTSIKFDGAAPLEPEIDYLVVVESDNGLSSVTASPPFGFRVATAEQMSEVNSKLAAVRSSGLKGDALAIAEAGVYSSGQLFADAIDVLNKTIARGSKEPAVYAYAAQLYRFVGLSREAATHYEEAIALADPSEDTELLTSASANLTQLKTIISRYEADVLQAKAVINNSENAETIDGQSLIAANPSSSNASMRSGGASSVFQSILTPQLGELPGVDSAIATDNSGTSNIRVRGGLGAFGGEKGAFGGENGAFGGENGAFGGENGAFGGENGAFGGEKGFGLDSTPESNQFGGERGGKP